MTCETKEVFKLLMRKEMDRIDGFLKSLLNKTKEDRSSVHEKGHTCPSEETVACYLDNLLNDTEVEDVEKHLTECEDCLQQTILLHKLKKEIKEEGYIKAPAEVVEEAKDLVPESSTKDLIEVVLGFASDAIRVIKDTGSMLVTPDAVPLVVREPVTPSNRLEDPKDLIRLSKVFGNIKTDIIIERINDNVYEMEVITTDPKTKVQLDDIRLNLLSNGRELASYLTINGRASFKNLCLGKYTLAIIMKSNIVRKVSIQLEKA